MRAFLLSLVLVALCTQGASAAWTAPVEGPVVGRFHVGPDPFAAGQRRGVDIASIPGARVAAPCGGRVVFAGAVPGFGVGVSLRCGALTATVLGLAGGLPRSEVVVHRGQVIGVVGAGGRVRLGARVTRQRFGYRDPLSLLAAEPDRRAPLVGPRGPSRRPAPRRVTPPPAALATAPSRPSGAPALAWIGLALIACSLPGGAIAWRVRRARVPLPRVRPSPPR